MLDPTQEQLQQEAAASAAAAAESDAMQQEAAQQAEQLAASVVSSGAGLCGQEKHAGRVHEGDDDAGMCQQCTRVCACPGCFVASTFRLHCPALQPDPAAAGQGVVVLVVYKQPGAATGHLPAALSWALSVLPRGCCCMLCSWFLFSWLAHARAGAAAAWQAAASRLIVPICTNHITLAAMHPARCRRGPDCRPGHCKGQQQQRHTARVCAAAQRRPGRPWLAAG